MLYNQENKRGNGHKVMDLSNLGSSSGISLFPEGSHLSKGYKSEAELQFYSRNVYLNQHTTGVRNCLLQEFVDVGKFP